MSKKGRKSVIYTCPECDRDLRRQTSRNPHSTHCGRQYYACNRTFADTGKPHFFNWVDNVNQEYDEDSFCANDNSSESEPQEPEQPEEPEESMASLSQDEESESISWQASSGE